MTSPASSSATILQCIHPPHLPYTLTTTNQPPYDIEYRSMVDDGWYTAGIVLLDGHTTLVVKLQNFPDTNDETFSFSDFMTSADVDQFVKRFRPLSEQLQDSECVNATPGTIVCVSYISIRGDIKFFDAIVDSVRRRKHLYGKEEECKCKFSVHWLHGPTEGLTTATSIESICLIQPLGKIDEKLAYFSQMAKQNLVPCVKVGSVYPGKAPLPDKRPTLSQLGIKVTQEDKQSRTQRKRGSCSRAHHFILVDNLEKDLSSSSVVEFIQNHTSTCPQAWIFPSLSSESYTRGVIEVDSKKKLKQIYKFLNNPNHIVTSSNGRPWVIHDEPLLCKTFETTTQGVTSILQEKPTNEELKIIDKESEEYRTAKRRRDLFLEFVEHFKEAHENLALEEKKISPPVPSESNLSRSFSCK